MNAKKCKALRRELRQQGADIVNHKYHQVGGDQVSKGRQIYLEAKEVAGAKPAQHIKSLPKTHSHRTKEARMHNKLPRDQRVSAWRTDTNVLVADYSMTPEKEERRLDASFLRKNPGAFSIRSGNNDTSM